ncbi:hypothetical protein [Actinoplanes sp. NPDC049681]|uniref:hypothetical protein n=1 Tax=Actinoplanes sp. NPDC049681 TaxID=3363905 RepID=UPI0037B07662
MAQARTQFAHLIDVDPDTLGPHDLARQLRDAGITIVCTPVGITLDTGTTPKTDTTSSLEAGLDSQVVFTALPRPGQAAKNPTKPSTKRE